MNTDDSAAWAAPIFFELSDSSDVQKLEKLRRGGKIQRTFDQMELAIEELYHIKNPTQIDEPDKAAYKAYYQTFGGGDTDKYGAWVYFPWNQRLTHFPAKDDLRRLRGSRNRNLITDAERQSLINGKTILIAGLSVGSNAVDSLLMQGIGGKYILVDMDRLAPTNLNRIRADYDQLGEHKVDIVAKKISQLDPFIDQIHYKNGLDENNLDEILKKHKPDIIIDAMDSLRLKLVLRLRAKQEGIPVLMATDDGDDILLDIERFDLDRQLPILHGLMPQPVIDEILKDKAMSRQEMSGIIGKYFVNLENVPLRMLESLMEIGKSLPSWPQLGGAAVLSGLYMAYAARKILLGQEINSGRFLMGPETQLNPAIKTAEYLGRKDAIIKRMMQKP